MNMSGKGPTSLAISAVAAITLALLTGGILVAGRFGDLSMRAGMNGMDGMNGQSGMSMGMDLRPVDTRGARTQPLEARGGQRLAPVLVASVKEFALTVEPVRWTILPNVTVGAYSYNGTVPGPEIRVTEGERMRVLVTNRLPEPTSIHWHGLEIDNSQDGAAGVTQEPIAAGQSFTYEFTARPAGTFFYHTHFASDRQQSVGLTAPLIIEPAGGRTGYAVERTIMLGEWNVDPQTGATRASMNQMGAFPNFFTINGKSYPSTESIDVKVGDRVRLNVVGSGQFIHPMHLHGQPFVIVATDGYPVPEGARLTKDTVLVGPGERYDVEFTARAPGKWLFHCHIADHITNNGAEEQGGGGLTMIVNVR